MRRLIFGNIRRRWKSDGVGLSGSSNSNNKLRYGLVEDFRLVDPKGFHLLGKYGLEQSERVVKEVERITKISSLEQAKDLIYQFDKLSEYPCYSADACNAFKQSSIILLLLSSSFIYLFF